MNIFTPLLVAHHCPEDHPLHLAALDFAQAIAAKTQGQIQISIYPNSALGDLPEMLHMTMDGRVDIVIAPQDRYVEQSQKMACVSLPFVFDSWEHADRVLGEEFINWITPDLRQLGLEALSCWDLGFRQVSSAPHPILQVADMHGLRVRVPPVLTTKMAMQALGGKLVLVEYSQLAKAMKLGVADVQENMLVEMLTLKLYESQNYLSVLNYSYCSAMLMINKNSFERLTTEQKNIVRSESRKIGQTLRKRIREQEQQQLHALAEQGMQIAYPDPAPFKAAMLPVYEKLKPVLGSENVATFLDMVERHRV